MTRDNELAVILATYERPDQICNLLDQLSTLDGSDEVEFIVVDQSREPLQAVLLERWRAHNLSVQYHHVTPANLPAARNYGLGQTKAAFALFLDDDVLVSQDLLIASRKASQEMSGDTAAIAGRVVLDGLAPSSTIFRISTFGTETGSFDVGRADPDVQGARGCLMLLRTKPVHEVGGFCSRYVRGAHREESDLFYRLRRAGYKIAYDPALLVRHLVESEGGTRQFAARTLEDSAFYANEFRFASRCRDVWQWPIYVLNVFLRRVLGEGGIRERRAFARAGAFLKGLSSFMRREEVVCHPVL